MVSHPAPAIPRSTARLRDRFFLFAFLCVGAFALITYLRLTFGTSPNGAQLWWNEPARDLALGFFPLGLSILLWEYWLRALRHEEIVEYVDRELMSALSVKLLKLTELENHGLIAIRHPVSNLELQQFVASAKHHLFVLVPWFVEPTVLGPIFMEKANIDGFTMRFVVLHPNSVFLKKRAEIVFGSAQAGQNESKKTLLILRNALRSVGSDRVEIRTYDSLPSAFIAQSDDRALLGFHLNTGSALVNPHFEIRMSNDGILTTLGRMIEEEFKKVSSNSFSSKVDCADIDDEGNLGIRPAAAPAADNTNAPVAGIGT